MSTKQWVEPESTSARILGKSKDKRETWGIRELGSKRADALRRASLGALPESTQLAGCAEGRELLTLFFDSELAPEFESVLPDSVASVAAARALAFLVFLGQLSAK